MSSGDGSIRAPGSASFMSWMRLWMFSRAYPGSCGQYVVSTSSRMEVLQFACSVQARFQCGDEQIAQPDRIEDICVEHHHKGHLLTLSEGREVRVSRGD